MSKRLTSRDKRNQDSEIRRQFNSGVGSALADFLSDTPTPSLYETAMGAAGYVGSPAWLEDRAETKRHFKPLSDLEHERANGGSGEPDHCANCRHPFMQHNNGRCPL